MQKTIFIVTCCCRPIPAMYSIMKRSYLRLLGLILFGIIVSDTTQAQSIVQQQQGKPSSIRGLSVIDDSIAWISGSRGYVAITRNGGKNWAWQQVKGFEKADFRDIEAFSDKEAVMMSSGTPALILKTTDGGETWQVKYRNTDTLYFLDAMDFVDKNILGDPINNKFLMLETIDGGETWAPFKNSPDAQPGEAAFAASGTCFRAAKNYMAISSGGTNARFINFNMTLGGWQYDSLPIIHHKPSQGAFSFALGKDRAVFVGGDYAGDKKTDSVAAYIKNRLNTKLPFTSIKTGPAGFQSSVEYIKDQIFVATGTPGSNITTNGGETWTKIDNTSFNVCRKAKHGKLVIFAGNGGKTGILKL